MVRRGWAEPTGRKKCQFYDRLHSPNPNLESSSLRGGCMQYELHIATNYPRAAMAYPTLCAAIGLILENLGCVRVNCLPEEIQIAVGQHRGR